MMIGFVLLCLALVLYVAYGCRRGYISLPLWFEGFLRKTKRWLFEPRQRFDIKLRAYVPSMRGITFIAIMGTAFLCMAAVSQFDLTTQVKGVLPVANGGTGTANAATGSAGGVVLSLSPSITTPTLTSPSFSGAIGTTFDLGTNAEVFEVTNAGTTGTTINKLAKLTGAPSTALITATTDTGGAIGIVVGGAGTAGNAIIAVNGVASCAFDAATTAGNYVSISASVAGDCHDAGASYPTTGQIVGRVTATNASAGSNNVLLFGYEIKGATTSTINFDDPQIPTGTINGVNPTFTTAHACIAASLEVYRNGQWFTNGASADFTYSGSTITVLTGQIPKTGENFLYKCRF